METVAVVRFSKGKFPKQVVSEWPEIFGDVEVSAIPVQYLKSINVTFKDGKKWEVRMKPNRKNVSSKELEATINEMFVHYKDAIKNVDFRLDVSKVKADISTRTKKFIKKNK